MICKTLRTRANIAGWHAARGQGRVPSIAAEKDFAAPLHHGIRITTHPSVEATSAATTDRAVSPRLSKNITLHK